LAVISSEICDNITSSREQPAGLNLTSGLKVKAYEQTFKRNSA